MVFVETSVFTRQIKDLMTDEEYCRLQNRLRDNPELGAVIPGSGGIRKVRVELEGRGRRGGARCWYYFFQSDDRVYMLLILPKNEQEDLTKEQLKQLKALVDREFS